MGDLNTFSEAYKAMSQEDRQALRELQAEESKRPDKVISLGDMVRAITPGLEMPEVFKQ